MWFCLRNCQIITGIEDLTLTESKTQADFKRLGGSRSIILDVLGIDTAGNKFDLEIQRADAGTSPKRSRYHSSALDIESLSAGQNFEELPETYVIFITENDVFGEN